MVATRNIAETRTMTRKRSGAKQTKKTKRKLSQDELAIAVVDHALMKEAAAYVARGRRYASLGAALFASKWVSAFRGLFAERDRGRRQEFDELDAEFRLRGLPPPHSMVEDVLASMRLEIKRMDPDGVPGDDVDRAIDDFFRERAKPSN